MKIKILANLFSHEILHVAAVRAADDELGARSHVLHLVAVLDLRTAEVALPLASWTVVGQVLVEKAAFELGSAAVAAHRRVELALFRVILPRHNTHSRVTPVAQIQIMQTYTKTCRYISAAVVMAQPAPR